MTKRVTLVGIPVLAVAMAAALWFFSPHRETDKYLGTWNYDQPNPLDQTNIARVSGGSYVDGIPQIGTVTFFRDWDGEIYGHTDQGCTWHFTPTPTGLALVGTNQYGFNRVVNFGYNISTWNLRFEGGRAKETMRATAYLPDGPVEFVLDNGRRSKVKQAIDVDSGNDFAGAWAYLPGDELSQVNILTRVTQTNTSSPVVEHLAQTGMVRFEPQPGSRLVAETDDGARWSLQVHGNTAELDPPRQSWTLPGGTVVMTFFAAASRGGTMTTMMAGKDPEGNPFVLVIGSLRPLKD